jgi:hypothetical protein
MHLTTSVAGRLWITRQDLWQFLNESLNLPGDVANSKAFLEQVLAAICTNCDLHGIPMLSSTAGPEGHAHRINFVLSCHHIASKLNIYFKWFK